MKLGPGQLLINKQASCMTRQCQDSSDSEYFNQELYVKLMTPRFQLDYLCLLLLKIGLIVKLLPESCIAMLKLKCLRHRCFRWFSHYKKSSPSSLPLLILLNIQYRHHHSSVTFIIHPCFLYVTKCCLRECIYGMYTNLYSQL